MKPVVELWRFVGLGLILEYPSGIIYSNQVGGTHHHHPRVEGAFVPIGNRIPDHEDRLVSPGWELMAYFEGPKYNYGGAQNGLDAEDADFIDDTLDRYSLEDVMTVNRDRLGDSDEAWVHVVVHREYPLFAGLGPYPRPGIITWMNTD